MSLPEPEAKLPGEFEPRCRNEVLDASLGKPPHGVSCIAEPVVHVGVLMACQAPGKSAHGQRRLAVEETVSPGRTKRRLNWAAFDAEIKTSEILVQPDGNTNLVTRQIGTPDATESSRTIV